MNRSGAVFRFAPSPNGRLHLGHAYSALVNFEMARQTGGAFLLRMEDIDVERCTPAFEQGICEDLQWLGIEWDDVIRRQSEHFADYRQSLDLLEAEGIVYRSFLSRSEARRLVEAHESKAGPWPRDPDGAPLYPGGRFETGSGDQPHVLRLDMKAALERIGSDCRWEETGAGPEGETGTVQGNPAAWGDVVVARRDTPTSYNLSVVVDDALQGVTDIVRGRDLFHATAVHVVLQELLGLTRPLYHHHDLVLGADGRKLSKTNRDTSLSALREAGATPGDIRRMVSL
ncbi:tRNA glutamyl-Q(34) synthetase GluQRS [Oricola cellulosilytica]|uniref:tRNA glutamyl-Q(34) synthetase GluQRS n=1 Tax=Oricola cellulosilytica TaxID=1429082 RepID=A0A4R0PB91_9HYPH|nr:tRNA glutamyl-Q(34) synthetase GluQRS [Oricola cellulosilytica]TCD13692.1 tRNA glutamyl-Q(34) synthetase GluQRS [Oricola cellulosilytica]